MRVVLTLGIYGLGSVAGAATKPKSKPTVVAVSVPGVGTVLVDTQGKALYTHTDANGQAVACTGACVTAWPPLTVAAGAKVKAPKGVKGLGTTSDTHQVTSTGLPLYRFSLDTQAKQAKGEGVNGFGGTWHVVTVKNAKTKDPDHERRHRRRVVLVARSATEHEETDPMEQTAPTPHVGMAAVTRASGRRRPGHRRRCRPSPSPPGPPGRDHPEDGERDLDRQGLRSSARSWWRAGHRLHAEAEQDGVHRQVPQGVAAGPVARRA